MITYKIIETRVQPDFVFTLVEYDIDGTILQIDVPHFQPQSESDIITGIVNRSYSERQRLNALEVAEQIVQTLPLNQITTIE